MAEIYLDPNKFQDQIDSFEKGAETIQALKYSLDKQGVRLRCVDRYMECVDEVNGLITLFSTMMAQDTESMKLIKAKWMNLDSDIATKTLGEILFGL
ncbi:MAG: hypothetical protein LUE87_03685 [Lachnospiraceae bacterium]|nr:hypothetical protein [Lachnospiraceae bacterium]